MTDKERAEVKSALVATEQYVFALIHCGMYPGDQRILTGLDMARDNMINTIEKIL